MLSLSLVLDSALLLNESGLYTTALPVLRVAFEHQVFDSLLFLANKHEVVVQGVSTAQWKQWQIDQQNGESWTNDVEKWSYKSGNVLVTWKGPWVKGDPDDRYTLSIYYGLYVQNDPFVGPQSHQSFLSRDFMNVDDHVELAKTYEDMRSRRLGWDHLKNHLTLNGLSNEAESIQLDVHYRFLSAFVHPHSEKAWNLVAGRNLPSTMPHYDHYASELVLLYVCTLAVTELKAFAKMTSQRPKVELSGWGEVDRLIVATERLTSHFWFPGGTPHQFDRVSEANNRGLSSEGKFVPRTERPHPADLADDEIRYYRDPLRRLIGLHSSFNELTGFHYVSPWHRDDAWSRV